MRTYARAQVAISSSQYTPRDNLERIFLLHFHNLCKKISVTIPFCIITWSALGRPHKVACTAGAFRGIFIRQNWWGGQRGERSMALSSHPSQVKTPWPSEHTSIRLKTSPRQAKTKEVSVSELQLLFGLTSSVIAAFVADASFASLAVYSNSVKEAKGS